jgi:hypothetical protein
LAEAANAISAMPAGESSVGLSPASIISSDEASSPGRLRRGLVSEYPANSVLYSTAASSVSGHEPGYSASVALDSLPHSQRAERTRSLSFALPSHARSDTTSGTGSVSTHSATAPGLSEAIIAASAGLVQTERTGIDTHRLTGILALQHAVDLITERS